MIRNFILCLLACALCMPQASAATPPKREIRTTWFTTVYAEDWPSNKSESAAKEELIQYLDALEGHNFTGICFQVRSKADAMYKSSYEPWCVELTGTRGKDPGWDPLAFAIEECHKRGLECYAWVNPYRIRRASETFSTSYDKEWKNNGWELANSSVVVFNPALKACRDHILKVIKEIYTNYAIDGMLFDDYFYPSGGISTSSSAPDYSQYKSYKNSGGSLSIANWRRKNVNDFMKVIYDAIQEDRPDMRFGISPAGVGDAPASDYGLSSCPGSDWQYDQIYSEPLNWMKNKALDFISPQLYWLTTHSTNKFHLLSDWWAKAADKFGCHFYASHTTDPVCHETSSGYDLSTNIPENYVDFPKQVNYHREDCEQYGTPGGSIYYPTKNFDGIRKNIGVGGLGDYLEENVYYRKSLVPVVDWKGHQNYGAPSSLAFTGMSISWDAVAGKGVSGFPVIMRYTVYAIPENVTLENAQASDGDGIDAQYLLGVSYETTYTIPADKREGYYYAVCVYDGYGYEYEPATTLKELEPSEATTLIAPSDGELVDWEATFLWNEVADAVYAIEISSSKDFTTLDYQKSGLSNTEVTIDLSKFQSNTTYYWRVATLQTDKKATVSAYETFKTGSKPYGEYEAGYEPMYDPAEYMLNDYDIENLWMRSTMSNFDNFSYSSDHNRGMAATEKYVYISGRSEGSSTADIYLLVFDALSGEYIKKLNLDSSGKCNSYPCNDVIKDSKGNICITNQSWGLASTALKIHRVNTETGALTQVASLTASDGGRVDHAAVYGDVTSGNFYVFAAVANTNKIYRWKITNGSAGTVKSVTVSEVFPASDKYFSSAPKILPVNENQVYVDGVGTYMTLYDLSSGEMLDQLDEGNAPARPETNGMARFTFDNNKFVVFSNYTSDKAYSFRVLASETDDDILSVGTPILELPEGSLGATYTATVSAPADAVVLEDEARIYLYTPLNGLAAYRMKVKSKTSGVESVDTDNNPMTIYDNVVAFYQDVEFIKAYNTAGMLVASVSNTNELSLPCAGNYIIVTPTKAVKIAVR